jgi:AcrR family transcriptional regulator
VTVAQVAAAADVSVATVFNYFASKEALVFDGMQAYEDGLIQAVRDRGPGRSALGAVTAYLAMGVERAGAPETSTRIAVADRLIQDSRTLRLREQEILQQKTSDLAAVLAEETHVPPGDPVAVVAAHALMGIHRTVLDGTRSAVLAGASGAELAAEVARLVTSAADTLERGLGTYAQAGATDD